MKKTMCFKFVLEIIFICHFVGCISGLQLSAAFLNKNNTTTEQISSENNLTSHSQQGAKLEEDTKISISSASAALKYIPSKIEPKLPVFEGTEIIDYNTFPGHSAKYQSHNRRNLYDKLNRTDRVKFLSRKGRSGKNVFNRIQNRGSSSGRINLSDSSSSPVEPIKPLLHLGSGSTGGLTLPPHPVFDDGAPKNVSGLQDNTAYLHCLVHNLGNNSVSWIRQRDLHILTVGRYTYTTDQRFEVLHKNGSKDWILKIKYAQVRDSGNYECQVSTKPIRSYVITLSLYAPKADIIGAPDMHVDRGSTINLTCVIENSPAPPAYIFWYHNEKVVNYDSPRGGITVVTERGNTTRGYLLIQDAKATDSGNYSCEPSNTGKTHLRVHVLHGELPAAMQSNGTANSFKNSSVILSLLIIVSHLKLQIPTWSLSILFY